MADPADIARQARIDAALANIRQDCARQGQDIAQDTLGLEKKLHDAIGSVVNRFSREHPEAAAEVLNQRALDALRDTVPHIVDERRLGDLPAAKTEACIARETERLQQQLQGRRSKPGRGNPY